MAAIHEVLRRLPELSKHDLEKVRQHVQLLGVSTTKKPPTPQQEDWLLEGFAAELRRRGLLAGGVWKNLLPDAWAEKSAAVQEFLLKGVPQKLSHAERVALAQLAAAGLADYFQGAKIPLSPKMLLNNIDKVPQALEAAFPGYWSARMLYFCFNRNVTSWSKKS